MGQGKPEITAEWLIKKLKDKATQLELSKITLFSNDVKRALLALNQESSLTNRKNLADAENVQSAFFSQLQEKYLFSEQKESDQNRIFPNRNQAWQYLTAEGWELSRKSFYLHCSNGKVGAVGKKFLKRDLDHYANIHCKKTEEKILTELSSAALAEEKIKVSLAREKVRLEREKRELAAMKGLYIKRSEVELVVIARAVAMLSHLKAMTQTEAPGWIDTVDGSQDRQRELIEAVWENIEETVSVFAKDIEFEVVFKKNIHEEISGDIPIQ